MFCFLFLSFRQFQKIFEGARGKIPSSEKYLLLPSFHKSKVSENKFKIAVTTIKISQILKKKDQLPKSGLITTKQIARR